MRKYRTCFVFEAKGEHDMTVKEILGMIADCPPDAIVSVAVSNGVQTTIMPASQIQVLVSQVEGRKVSNLVVIHNEKEVK